MHRHRGGNTQPNNQFNYNKLVSIKLGTLLSSQTTTTPGQHTHKPTNNPWRSAPRQLSNLTPTASKKQTHPNSGPTLKHHKTPAKTGNLGGFSRPQQAGQLEKQYTQKPPHANPHPPPCPVDGKGGCQAAAIGGWRFSRCTSALGIH